MPSIFSISARGSVFRLRGVRTERIASRDPSLFGLVTRNCACAKTIAQKTRHPTEVLGTNAEYFSMSVECREAHNTNPTLWTIYLTMKGAEKVSARAQLAYSSHVLCITLPSRIGAMLV